MRTWSVLGACLNRARSASGKEESGWIEIIVVEWVVDWPSWR